MIRAKGGLRHCWFGDYSARIVLQFENEAQAKLAQEAELKDWKQAGPLLGIEASGRKLQIVEAHLGRLGADRKKMTSLAKSIDYGEPFWVEIAPPASEVQASLGL